MVLHYYFRLIRTAGEKRSFPRWMTSKGTYSERVFRKEIIKIDGVELEI